MPQLQDLTSDMGLTKSNAHRGTKKKKDEIIIRLYMGFREESSHHPTDRTFPKRLATVSNLYLLEGSISHTPGLCNGDICNSGAWSRVTAESKTRCFPVHSPSHLVSFLRSMPSIIKTILVIWSGKSKVASTLWNLLARKIVI